MFGGGNKIKLEKELLDRVKQVAEVAGDRRGWVVVLADGADQKRQGDPLRVVFAYRSAVDLGFEVEVGLGAVEEHFADLFDAEESQVAVEILELGLGPVDGLETRAAILALLDIEVLQGDDGLAPLR